MKRAKRFQVQPPRTHCLVFIVVAMVLLPSARTAPLARPQTDTAVFSGPQVGETLPPFEARGLFGDLAGKEIDFVEASDGKPILLIFFHELTRPAFGLTRAVGNYAASKSKDGLRSCVVFLTDDPTATEKWAKGVVKHLPPGVTYCISRDGKEGPGSYGLNRNVTLTVLVGRQGKVTANFALVQPQLQADGPKILRAVVDATGGGEVPSIEKLLAGGPDGVRERMNARSARVNPRREMGGQRDPKLTSLLRAVINKQANEEAVKKAAAEVETYVAENENARKELARIATTVVNSGKLSNYGTEPAQKILRSWLKKYGDAPKEDNKPVAPTQ